MFSQLNKCSHNFKRTKFCENTKKINKIPHAWVGGGYHNTQEVIYNKHYVFNSIFLYHSNKYQHNLQSVIVNWYPHSKWTPILHSLGGLLAYFLQTPTQNSRHTNRTSICDPTHPTSIQVFPKLLQICSVFILMAFFMSLEHFLFISCLLYTSDAADE